MTILPHTIHPKGENPASNELAPVLLDSQSFLQSTLDALTSHIAILDEHGTILAVNAGWKCFARENGFIGSHYGVGDNYLKVCDSATGASSEGALEMASKIRSIMSGNRGEFHLEYPCHSPGVQRWFIARVTCFYDGDGPMRVVVAHENITEPKQSEELVRRALEHEQALHQNKSRFVRMVSHEFRTPLGVIKIAAHVLGRYSDRLTAEEQFEHIHEIQDAVDRMTRMMDDFVLYEKLETGKLECKPARVDVEALCRKVISGVPNRPSAPCLIEFTIHPAARGAFLDEKILNHILGNLLGNAVKYSYDGQPVTLEVKHVVGNSQAGGCTITPLEDRIELKVSDSGIGIPASDISKLFQAFHRASNVGNRQGNGMGLAIVKHCVGLHRGTIHVQSEEGKGTSVWVWLPTNSPDAAVSP